MENESDKIGLLIPGVRGLTSPTNPWVRLVKKESFLFFIWRAAASHLKNTHLTKGTKALNRRIEGLPDIPDIPGIPDIPDIPDSKTGCNQNESDKIGSLIPGVRGLISPTNPWVRLVKKESFLFLFGAKPPRC